MDQHRCISGVPKWIRMIHSSFQREEKTAQGAFFYEKACSRIKTRDNVPYVPDVPYGYVPHVPEIPATLGRG